MAIDVLGGSDATAAATATAATAAVATSPSASVLLIMIMVDEDDVGCQAADVWPTFCLLGVFKFSIEWSNQSGDLRAHTMLPLELAKWQDIGLHKALEQGHVEVVGGPCVVNSQLVILHLRSELLVIADEDQMLDLRTCSNQSSLVRATSRESGD